MNYFSLALNDNSSVADSAVSSLLCRCRRPIFCRHLSKPSRQAGLRCFSSAAIVRLAGLLQEMFRWYW
jgi:hypothetical protein